MAHPLKKRTRKQDNEQIRPLIFLILPARTRLLPWASVSAFDQLASMPALRELCNLVWRLFGVNPALVSSDGQRVVIFEREKRLQPFCSALQTCASGRDLCTMCDRNRFVEARGGGLMLRYRCHAGLNEFIVPVIRNGETIALIQCGQVHDRRPTEKEWKNARRELAGAGINSRPLRKLFRQNRVLSPDRQRDLLQMLGLIAKRLAHADEHPLSPDSSRTQLQLGRAVTFIEVHLAERLSLPVIARAAGVSTRSLVRLFRKEVGTSVVQFILRRRVAHARNLLERTDQSCSEIAFESGFGSIQHFNRVFRKFETASPAAWRHRISFSGHRMTAS